MLSTDNNTLIIYTDGSSRSSPRRGGYGIRFILPVCLGDSESILEFDSPKYPNETNNAMELLAVVDALKHFDEIKNRESITRIIVNTDSMYIVKNFYNAKYVWPKSKWFLKNGNPVENAAQWKDLVRMVKKIRARVDIMWVKGHSKDLDNLAVDKIAKNSADSIRKKKVNIYTLRKKISSLKVQRESIKAEGQRLSIRIINSKRMPVQKMNRYQYEVIYEGSKYFQCVDIIYSELNLKPGHSYLVSLEKNNRRVVISKVIKEIIKDE